MEMLSPVTDDEREDGEIVDDDFEDISDYSIPSCGKSDYSKGLLRAISLSSISDSDGEREYREKRYAYITLNECGHRKRKSRRSTMAIRKRRRDSSISVISCNNHMRSRKRQKKSLSRSSSSDTSSSDILDRRTLKQLNKAVRIDCGSGDELHHNSLKHRLKRMIQPDAEEEASVDADVLDNANTVKLDETMDKELEELRLQALKSAMLKKHMERKRRKEMTIMNSQLNVQNGDLTNSNNDKENTESNIITTNSEEPDSKISTQDMIEDDLDIMRAMLLASMSKKITEDQPSPSISPIPIPPEIVSIKKSLPAIKLPPVKPLIIQLNTGSDSDTDSEYDQAQRVPANKLEPRIQTSVDELLRKQREQFEAKLVEAPGNDKQDDLDKSFLKLLPKSQQQEYKLLKQKLLQARRTNGKTNAAPQKQVAKILGQKAANPPKDKKERLQTKGKYKELAPIIKKINAEVTARRKCEDTIQMLMEQLQKARVQLNAHQHRYTSLVVQLKTTRKAIDLRIANNAAIKPLPTEQPKPRVLQTTIPFSKNIQRVNVPKVELPNVQAQNVVAITIDNPIIVEATKHQEVSVKDTDVTECVQSCCAIEPPIVITKDVVHEERKEDENEEERTDQLAYVSPLDRREVSHSNNNPLQMLCPYELFGVCKDKNCTFNHCP